MIDVSEQSQFLVPVHTWFHGLVVVQPMHKLFKFQNLVLLKRGTRVEPDKKF